MSTGTHPLLCHFPRRRAGGGPLKPLVLVMQIVLSFPSPKWKCHFAGAGAGAGSGSGEICACIGLESIICLSTAATSLSSAPPSPSLSWPKNCAHIIEFKHLEANYDFPLFPPPPFSGSFCPFSHLNQKGGRGLCPFTSFSFLSHLLSFLSFDVALIASAT